MTPVMGARRDWIGLANRLMVRGHALEPVMDSELHRSGPAQSRTTPQSGMRGAHRDPRRTRNSYHAPEVSGLPRLP